MSANIQKFEPEQIEVIKKLIAPDLNETEMQLFLHNCVRTGLDPQLRQVYPLKVWNKKKNRHDLITLVGIDGYRLIADRTGCYAPGRPTDFIYDDKGRIVGARAYVKKLTNDGSWHEVSGQAMMSEYEHTFAWKKMPHVMIEKVAESRALRRAFPANLGGIYTEDEIQSAKETESEVTTIDVSVNASDYQRMIAVIGDHEALIKDLKRICCVSDLSKINKQQFEACQKYAQQWLKANGIENKNATSEHTEH